MNELMNLSQSQTMSSREIAELTSKEHRSVLRDIDILNDSYESLGMHKVVQTPYTNPQNGQQYREYQLSKMQTFDLMTGYNVELRIKVNRRWEELETKTAIDFTNPQTVAMLAQNWAAEQQKRIQAEAMIALKDSELILKDEIIDHQLVEISHKEQELKITTPKAATYDAHISSKETLTTTNIAMEIGMSAVKLNKLLEERGVQRKVNGIWTLNAKYNSYGYAVLKPYIEVNQTTGESKTYYQMVWTAKGRIWIKNSIELIKAQSTTQNQPIATQL